VHDPFIDQARGNFFVTENALIDFVGWRIDTEAGNTGARFAKRRCDEELQLRMISSESLPTLTWISRQARLFENQAATGVWYGTSELNSPVCSHHSRLFRPGAMHADRRSGSGQP
jgi:hypothetical protein